MVPTSTKPLLNLGHLLPVLDEKLIELLHSLTKEEWEKQTIARKWKVKDVAAHLLDGNIRALSFERDRYYGQPGPEKNDFKTIVDWLNRFNNEWVNAAKRISPLVMVMLHEATLKPSTDYLLSLDPWASSVFAVDWAGEEKSQNWLHIARHYTEKWHHQQQIREAVNKPGIITKELYPPLIITFMYAMPHTYRNVSAPEDTIVKLTIPSDAGGCWMIKRKEGHWQQCVDEHQVASAEVIIEPGIAWKLFTKSLRGAEIKTGITILGDKQLGEVALEMVSVMA